MILVFDYFYSLTWLEFLRGNIGSIFFITYFLVFSLIQAIIIPKALFDDKCHDALIQTSPSNNNTLEILAWINMIVDWLFSIGLISYYIIRSCLYYSHNHSSV